MGGEKGGPRGKVPSMAPHFSRGTLPLGRGARPQLALLRRIRYKRRLSTRAFWPSALGESGMFRHNAKLSSSRACAQRRVTAIYRIVACALVFLGAALVVWQSVLAYDDQLKQLAAQLADAISKSGKKTVAVADF